MNLKKSLFFGIIFVFPVILWAGNPYIVSFPVLNSPTSSILDQEAVQNSGAVIVRDNIPGQEAYQMAGMDGSGIGRIFSRPGQPSYVLTDVGSQWVSGIGVNQTILAIIECYSPQFGWDGPAYSAAETDVVTKSSIMNGRIFMQALTLTAVPVPSLLRADTSTVQVNIPPYIDSGGVATGLVLWRQDSAGTWQSLTTLPLSGNILTYGDRSVLPNASYWYGVSVIYAWPGGSQAGALPTLSNQYVSMARSRSSVMVAALVQPTPTFAPTFTPTVKHDLGSIGWAAGPNPNRDGKFNIEFQTTKPASWLLQVFGLDGSQVKEWKGSTQRGGWQVAGIDLSHLASGVYLMALHVKQEGETEKTLPLRKVAIIR
jgi:hypothetical protein